MTLTLMTLRTFLLTALFFVVINHPQKPRSLQLQNSPNKNDIVHDSRQAIVQTGMSEKYFDEHVSLVEFIDKPGDLRVVWRYSLNGYTANLNDAIGFYSGPNQKRIYLHSIKDVLKSTHDIKKTLSRNQAMHLMTSCIGKHSADTVLFLKLSTYKYSTFYLTAHSLASARLPRKEDKAQEVSPRQAPSEPDKLEPEQIHEPMKIGYINLETGRCTRAKAIVAP